MFSFLATRYCLSVFLVTLSICLSVFLITLSVFLVTLSVCLSILPSNEVLYSHTVCLSNPVGSILRLGEYTWIPEQFSKHNL